MSGNSGNHVMQSSAIPLRVRSQPTKPPFSGSNVKKVDSLHVGVGGVFGVGGPPSPAAFTRASPCPCSTIADNSGIGDVSGSSSDTMPIQYQSVQRGGGGVLVPANSRRSSSPGDNHNNSNVKAPGAQKNLMKGHTPTTNTTNSTQQANSTAASISASVKNNSLTSRPVNKAPSSSSTPSQPFKNTSSAAIATTTTTLIATSTITATKVGSPTKPNLSKYSKLATIASSNSTNYLKASPDAKLSLLSSSSPPRPHVGQSLGQTDDISESNYNDNNISSRYASNNEGKLSDNLTDNLRDSYDTINSDLSYPTLTALSSASSTSYLTASIQTSNGLNNNNSNNNSNNCGSNSNANMDSEGLDHEVRSSHTSVIKQCIERFRSKDFSASTPINREDFWWLKNNSTQSKYSIIKNDITIDDAVVATTNPDADILASTTAFPSPSLLSEQLRVHKQISAGDLTSLSSADPIGKSRQIIPSNSDLYGNNQSNKDIDSGISSSSNSSSNSNSNSKSDTPSRINDNTNNDKLDLFLNNGGGVKSSGGGKAPKEVNDLLSNYENEADNLLQKCENLLKEYKFEYSTPGRVKGAVGVVAASRSSSSGSGSGTVGGARSSVVDRQIGNYNVSESNNIINDEYKSNNHKNDNNNIDQRRRHDNESVTDANLPDVGASDELNDIFEILGTRRGSIARQGGSRGHPSTNVVVSAAAASGGKKNNKRLESLLLSSFDSFASIDMVERLPAEPGMDDEDEVLEHVVGRSSSYDDDDNYSDGDSNGDDGSYEDIDDVSGKYSGVDDDGNRSSRHHHNHRGVGGGLGLDIEGIQSDDHGDDFISPFSSKSNLTQDSFNSISYANDDNYDDEENNNDGYDVNEGGDIPSQVKNKNILMSKGGDRMTAVRSEATSTSSNPNPNPHLSPLHSNNANNVDEADVNSSISSAFLPRISVNGSHDFMRSSSTSPSSNFSPRSILKQSLDNSNNNQIFSSSVKVAGASVKVSFDKSNLVLTSIKTDERDKSGGGGGGGGGEEIDDSSFEYFISPDSSVDLRGFAAAGGGGGGGGDVNVRDSRSKNNSTGKESDNIENKVTIASSELGLLDAPINSASVDASDFGTRKNESRVDKVVAGATGSRRVTPPTHTPLTSQTTITWDEVKVYMTDPIVHRLYNQLIKQVNRFKQKQGRSKANENFNGVRIE